MSPRPKTAKRSLYKDARAKILARASSILRHGARLDGAEINSDSSFLEQNTA